MTILTARLAYAPRRFDAARIAVELGHEPAIQLAGGRAEARDRRRAPPLRWLLGVALTGLSGLALIGSTLYLDLDRKSNFAEAPEFAAPPRREAAENEAVNPGKGEAVKLVEHEGVFFRDIVGYSIGTLGIHRLGVFLAISAAFWSAVCIVLSGPFWTRGWPEWWGWWYNLPIWG